MNHKEKIEEFRKQIECCPNCNVQIEHLWIEIPVYARYTLNIECDGYGQTCESQSDLECDYEEIPHMQQAVRCSQCGFQICTDDPRGMMERNSELLAMIEDLEDELDDE